MRTVLPDLGRDFAGWLGRLRSPDEKSEQLVLGLFLRMLAALVLVALLFAALKYA